MKKIKIFFVALLAFGACKKDITTLNDPTKKPAVVPAGTLFAYATKSYSDAITSTSVNTNVFRFVVGHWAMTTYQDELQYDFNTREIPKTWWTIMYRDVLQNLTKSAGFINSDPLMEPGVKVNKLAILDIMQVVAYSTLVNTFGNVPYSKALDENNLFPVYDDAKTISLDLIKRLNADIAQLNTNNKGFTATEDLIYLGDIAKWIKFANSLRMQQAMILADADHETAKAGVEASDAGAISVAADNASFAYLAGAPNQNPLYVDIVTGGRGDYVAANDLLNKLKTLSDPRLRLYYSPNSDGVFVGGISGAGNSLKAISNPNPILYAANAPTLFMDYAETEFFRAEAVERGYAVSGTAEEHYNNAITASIIYWGGTTADAATYLKNASVAYQTAAGTWREKIGVQKWIALYNRPFNGWTELRRFDYPKITPPVGAKSGFPVRLNYPTNEQQLNGANYTAAAAAIGGDVVTTKLFWDKF
ncbi:SusD/RagB family nutrient-binding outer membrane lipoprotein [Pedobacter jeongneungensis]|uniref:SusD/RagB family nutrient-binding outer membrane lipoprotein n=1 Tax=Pedobacter jeongneungensis TaxID=947309 RepID=UPI00046880E8|nr:SusD/RagB family nutrient-binding outer membrane lipoprotein [Pedobacter jeongneungensis]